MPYECYTVPPEMARLLDSAVSKLKPELVRRWLSDRPPDEVVGRQRTSFGCPLATYLGEAEHKAILVGAEHITVPQLCQSGLELPPEPYRRPMPAFALNFVHLVDGTQDLDGVITAAQALRVLDVVAPEPMVLVLDIDWATPKVFQEPIEEVTNEEVTPEVEYEYAAG